MADLWHSWGTSPRMKKLEKEYNAKYYQEHKDEILNKRKASTSSDDPIKDFLPGGSKHYTYDELKAISRNEEAKTLKNKGYTNAELRRMGYDIATPTRSEYVSAGREIVKENALQLPMQSVSDWLVNGISLYAKLMRRLRGM